MEKPLVPVYEKLREIYNAHQTRAAELAIRYLKSEDEADKREALAHLQFVSDLDPLMMICCADSQAAGA
jgi:hypothetical protein